MNKHPLKEYPIVGACGLDCGLCPRYHTEGNSRCPGCAGPDFGQKHPPCGFITCCVKQHSLETCAQCPEWSGCQRVAKVMAAAKQEDSFISYRPVAANFAFIREHGIEEFARLETEKMEFLKYLLANYNEGRSKMFYCLSCQLIPLEELKATVTGAAKGLTSNMAIKDKAKAIRAAISDLAARLHIDLRLRK